MRTNFTAALEAIRVVRLACSICLFLMSAVVAAQGILDEGQTAYDAGDYKTAIQKWEVLIRQGNPDGLYFLGVMYAQGKGVAQDKTRAFSLYAEAAQKNHIAAQYNIGMLYATGEGVARDFFKAEYWWTKAAEGGLMSAQFNLGKLYYYGIAEEKNLAMARKWLTIAERQGSSQAKAILARLDEEEGRPVSPTLESGVKLAAASKLDAQIPPATTPDTTRISTDALRREAWVLAQPPAYYTIQILAADSDAAVREYIGQHALSAYAAYLENSSRGATVFRVIYGTYANRELANKAMAALPQTIRANSPWIRSFAEVHNLVDSRYAQRGAN